MILYYRRSESNFTLPVIIHLGLNETFIEKRRTNKRQLGGQTHYKTKFLEVIYVADEYAKDLYGSIDLPEMLLSIGNIVRMFSISSSSFLQ